MRIMRSQIGYSACITALMALAVCVFVYTCVATDPPKVQEAQKVDWYYDQIYFEIATVVGATPDAAALDQFRERLHENGICRRGGVVFRVQAMEYPPPPGPWDSAYLIAFEMGTRDYQDIDPEDRDLSVFIAYIDGFMVEGDELFIVGGLTYDDTSFAIFKDLVGDIEADVLLHEFGHVMGMVTVTADSYDEDHESHCTNQNCVMYWRVPPGPDFGEDCRKEIKRLARKRQRKSR